MDHCARCWFGSYFHLLFGYVSFHHLNVAYGLQTRAIALLQASGGCTSSGGNRSTAGLPYFRSTFNRSWTRLLDPYVTRTIILRLVLRLSRACAPTFACPSCPMKRCLYASFADFFPHSSSTHMASERRRTNVRGLPVPSSRLKGLKSLLLISTSRRGPSHPTSTGPSAQSTR